MSEHDTAMTKDEKIEKWKADNGTTELSDLEAIEANASNGNGDDKETTPTEESNTVASEVEGDEVDPDNPNGIPRLIPMQFIGIPNKNFKYIGDDLECHLDRPDSCLVEVSQVKAKQLLQDMPKQWKIIGSASTAKHIKKVLSGLEFAFVKGGTPEALKGVDKLVLKNGTEIEIPAGAIVTIKAARRR